MSLELVKLIAQPVILKRDEAGRITGEELGQATPLYSLEELATFWQTLEEQIAQANEGGQPGGSNGKMADAPQVVEPTEGGAGERDSDTPARRVRA
jgi:hypothetical protein